MKDAITNILVLWGFEDEDWIYHEHPPENWELKLWLSKN